MIRVGAACEGFQKHENKAPESDADDEDIVESAKRFTLIEDPAIEEEDTEFDAAVSELLNHESGVVDLSRSSA